MTLTSQKRATRLLVAGSRGVRINALAHYVVHVARRNARVFTIRWTTVVRIGVVALVLAALGTGIAIGLTVGSRSSQDSTEPNGHGSNTTSDRSTTSESSTTTSTTVAAAAVPVVLSCGPATTKTVRPKTLTLGCALGAVTVTDISWSSWGTSAGGQGSGILNQDNCQPDCLHGTVTTLPAIVVVFQVVNGVFQDVSITPSQNVSSGPKVPTTTSTAPGIVPSTTTTSSPPASGLKPLFAAQPGSGWGGQ